MEYEIQDLLNKIDVSMKYYSRADRQEFGKNYYLISTPNIPGAVYISAASRST